MKKFLFCFALLCFLGEFIYIYADTPEDHILNRYRERVEVTIKQKQDVRTLIEAGLEVDGVKGLKVDVYAAPHEVDKIKNLGFDVLPNPVTIGQDSRDAAYHTYSTLTSDLQNFAATYPSIAKLESIGKSVEGRELWAMKISDNVAQDEAEPEFKYVSTMHGDEVVGMEMLMSLIDHLLKNYGTDSEVTSLVNDLEIWIIPDMNPDGTAKKMRYNANYVDLNRNFPDPQAPDPNTTTGKAVETQLMMNFTKNHNFSISANFHGGALVMNYPWDTMSGKIPDNDLVVFLSLGYSTRNKPMYNSSEFPQGITNGYDWYEVNGGMQDWNYYYHNDLDITIELSNTKWPDASTLAGFWSDNKDSLIWYMKQIRRGVHGIITDKDTGAPIKATVSVSGINKDVVSSALNGDYHRVLLKGTYNLTFSAQGYNSFTVNNVVVQDSDSSPTVLNVQLQKSR